jgi:4-hydroxy 2-oxovalerate aldolase
MDKFNILECTLRDGGYITGWKFDDMMIVDTIQELTEANFDFIEVGYLHNKSYVTNSTQFQNIEQIVAFLPENRKNTMFLAMADIEQYKPTDITPFTGKSIDGIRVVFYKHQIEDAIMLCKAVRDNGYKLFVQPMVTIDYTLEEYIRLIKQVIVLQPYAISIVDSFGYMNKNDFRKYFKVLDNILDSVVMVGFHSHNNMNLAFITAQDILEYETNRKLIVDASLYGMGRGAGNLNTELIAHYYNMIFGEKYDIRKIMCLISNYIMPIAKEKRWGYSPYLFLTGLYQYHPNYASYLLEEYQVTVEEFEQFLLRIPTDMKKKCRKPFFFQMWKTPPPPPPYRKSVYTYHYGVYFSPWKMTA